MAFTANERNTLALTAVGHFGVHFAMLVFPTAAIVIARAEGLALETVIGWSFAGYLIFGLGALPVGLLTDHLRARWVVRASVLGIGPALMAVAWAEPGASMAAALAVVGLFASLYHPPGLGLISRTITARGTALGINGVFGNLGIAMAPALTEAAAAVWGWRGAYLSLGLALGALGLAVAFLPITEPPLVADQGGQRAWSNRKRLLLFAVLMSAMTLGGLSYRAATVAQPAYFAERINLMGYGAATSLVYMLGTLGQFLAGRMADRHDLRLLYFGFHAISLPLVLSMAFLHQSALLAAASAFIFFSIGMQPVENSLVARFTPERWRSTGYGLKFSVVFGVGALSVRAVEAFILNYSLAHVFMGVAVVVAGIVTIAGLLAWLTRGRPITNPGAQGSL